MSGVLLAGSAGASLIGLVVVSLVTKGLSLKEYGLIVMVQAYFLFMDQIFNFQSWQPLIKYGVSCINSKDNNRLSELLRISIFLDIMGSLLAFLFSLLLFKPLSFVFKFNIQELSPFLFFALLLLVRWIGTPTALLRINDQYKVFNYQQLINWGGKLVAVLILNFSNLLTVKNVLVAFLICEILAALYLLIKGLGQLGRYRLNFIDVLPRGNIISTLRNEKRFLMFAFRANLNGAILGSVRTLDELIVGGIVGPSSAAIFKVMKLVGNIVARLLEPFYTVIYPEFSKLVDKGAKSSIQYMIKKVSLVNAAIGTLGIVLFFFFGEFFITMAFTKDYLFGLPMMKLYLVGIVFSFVFFYVQPLMLAFELEGKALIINLVASIGYILILYFTLPVLDIWSVVIAFMVFTTLVVFPKIYFLQSKEALFFNNKAKGI